MNTKSIAAMAIFTSVFLFGCKKEDSDTLTDSSYCDVKNAQIISVLSVQGADSSLNRYEYSAEGDLLKIFTNEKLVNEFIHPDKFTQIIRVYNSEGALSSTTTFFFADNGSLSKTEKYASDSSTRTDEIYHYNDVGELVTKSTWALNKPSGYTRGIQIDSSIYDWNAGNIEKMSFYFREEKFSVTEYTYNEDMEGRQFARGLPGDFSLLVMAKNISRENATMTRNFCVKVKIFNVGLNRYVDTFAIQPTFDKSNKLIQFSTSGAWENSDGDWENVSRTVYLDYRCR